MKFLQRATSTVTKIMIYNRKIEGSPNSEVQNHNFNKLDISPQQRNQLSWTKFHRYNQLKQQVEKTAPSGAENIYHTTRKKSFEELQKSIKEDFDGIKKHPYSAGLNRSATPAEIKDTYYNVTVPSEDRIRATDYLGLMRREAESQVGVIDTNGNRRTGDNYTKAQFITDGAREQFPGTMPLGEFALLLAESKGISLTQGEVKTLLSDKKQRSAVDLFRYRYEKISGEKMVSVDKFNVNRISTHYNHLGYDEIVVLSIVQEIRAAEANKEVYRETRSLITKLEQEANEPTTYLEFAEKLAKNSNQTLDPQTKKILQVASGTFPLASFTKSLTGRVPQFTYTNAIMYMREKFGNKEMSVSEYIQTRAKNESSLSLGTPNDITNLKKAVMKYKVIDLVKHEKRLGGPDKMHHYVTSNISRFKNIA